jgi:hypothetical protein
MSIDPKALFEAEKILPTRPEWQDLGQDQIGFTTSLDIDAVTVEGLTLRRRAMSNLPDRNVIFQLEVHPPHRRVIALSRICWNPLGPHNNKKKGPPELRQKFQHGSHYHRFDLNFSEDQGNMKAGNLKVAVPLDTDPATFEELIVLMGNCFRISNVGLIEPPIW